MLAEEDPGSILADVAAHAPGLFRALDEQRHDHRRLDDAIGAVRRMVAGAIDEVGVATARYAVARASRDLCRHLDHGDCAAWAMASGASLSGG